MIRLLARIRRKHWSIEHGDVPDNWLFIAMAYWQLDQKDQSKQLYDKSIAWQSANAAAANYTSSGTTWEQAPAWNPTWDPNGP